MEGKVLGGVFLLKGDKVNLGLRLKIVILRLKLGAKQAVKNGKRLTFIQCPIKQEQKTRSSRTIDPEIKVDFLSN